MDVFSLVGKIKLEGSDKVKSELSGLEGAIEKNSAKLKALGAAFTALGVAGLKMASDARKLNAQLGATGLTIGATTKEMRNLALSVTNVTFPLESVTATFDLLARAGVRSTEQMAKAATAFDTLADAVGSSAEVVADQLIPAFKNLGVEIPTTAAELDKFTWLTKNTTVGLSDFASAMDYVAAYGGKLNITVTDMVAIMAALEAKGITGSAVTRVFRTAISQASTSLDEYNAKLEEAAEDKTINYEKAVEEANKKLLTLNEALGLTSEEVDTYKGKLSEASGITQQYADVVNTQYGLMDKLKQKWSELTLQLGSFLEPLEPILAGMTALGPLLIFVSTQNGIAAVKWAAHTAAEGAHKAASLAATAATKLQTMAQWELNTAMFANPIGWIILAIAGLVAGIILLVKNWDKVTAAFKKAGAFFKKIWDDIVGFFKKAWDWIYTNFIEKFIIAFQKVGNFFKKVWDGITGVFKTAINFILSAVEGFVNFFIKGINWIIGALNKIHFKFPDWLPGPLKGKDFGINITPLEEVKLPRLAEGGIVSQPTLAMIGETGPEAIVPLGQMSKSGNEIHIHIGQYLGDEVSFREFARKLKNVLDQEGRRNAFGPVNQGYFYGRSSV